MKKILLILAGISLVIALVTTYAPRPSKSPASQLVATAIPSPSITPQNLPFSDREIIAIKVGDRTLRVEAVTTDQSTTQGLSGRSEIGSDGMLFVFKERRIPTFWMKDMRFALDFIWIDAGRVVDISENVPPPPADATLSDLEVISPQEPAQYVLEVPAGSLAKWGVKIGDSVVIQPE